MPIPYSLDLRWRVIWVFLSQNLATAEITEIFGVCERTVRRYIDLFEQTGEVESVQASHGPKPLLDSFEQLTLLKLILQHPGIYLKELQGKLQLVFGVCISMSTICRNLKRMGCTRQAMHHIALQRSDMLRAKYMADISVYDPDMLVWVDESGCDRRNTIRKYGYSIRGIPLCNQHLLVRGTPYSAIPVVSTAGVHDVYLAEGNINGERFTQFVESCLLAIHAESLQWCQSPFRGDYGQCQHSPCRYGSRFNRTSWCFLPPYSPDLNPVEGVFSQVKNDERQP